MHVIINGRRYDTETAERIAAYSSLREPKSAMWFTETLYRTPRSKRYFLRGRGGSGTKYRTAGELGRIIPISNAEAEQWMKEFYERRGE